MVNNEDGDDDDDDGDGENDNNDGDDNGDDDDGKDEGINEETWWSSRSLEHVFVFGDGEVDGVEDGAVLVQRPGVDVDEVGDFLPVPPGVEGGLTHHGRGVAEGPTTTKGGIKQYHK